MSDHDWKFLNSMSTHTATMPPEMSTDTAPGATLTPFSATAEKESLGRTLKRTREEKNLSLDEAARATKIRKEFLLAIEDDKLDQLPGPVFARGFVRSYAEYLSLDAPALLVRVSRALEGKEPVPSLGATKKAALVSWPILTAGAAAAASLAAFLATR